MNVNYINHSNLKKIKSNYILKNNKWNNVSILLGVLFFFCAIFFVFSVFSNRAHYQIVCNHLSDEDSILIISNLVKLKVPYRYVSSSGELFVPKNEINKVYLMLSSQGLPKRKNVGFELLDQEKFGMNPFNIQIRYQRALEGELSQFIQTINTVKTAQVHISFPQESSFLQDTFLPSASVILTFKDGKHLNFSQCRAITHLISASVPKLLPKNVVILDQNGNFLNKSKKIFHNLHFCRGNKTEFLVQKCRQKIIYILKSVFQLKNFSVQVKLIKRNVNSDTSKFFFINKKIFKLHNIYKFLSLMFFKNNKNVFFTDQTLKQKVSILIFINSMDHKKNQLISLNNIQCSAIRNVISKTIDFLDIDCMNFKIIDVKFNNNKDIFMYFNLLIFYLNSIPHYLLMVIIFIICFLVIKTLRTSSINNIQTSNTENYTHENIHLLKMKNKNININTANCKKDSDNLFKNTILMKDITNIVKSDPKLVAKIIKNWINKKK